MCPHHHHHHTTGDQQTSHRKRSVFIYACVYLYIGCIQMHVCLDFTLFSRSVCVSVYVLVIYLCMPVCIYICDTSHTILELSAKEDFYGGVAARPRHSPYPLVPVSQALETVLQHTPLLPTLYLHSLTGI